jgi:hypothetical protein
MCAAHAPLELEGTDTLMMGLLWACAMQHAASASRGLMGSDGHVTRTDTGSNA